MGELKENRGHSKGNGKERWRRRGQKNEKVIIYFCLFVMFFLAATDI